ncbi:hypothetical protein FUA26_11280 [Seonamhaeicola algicola]|uniref:Lipocalin-like domain-containing protein n=1 Tax=Seonamhaeicola algicola TaxID=1719036 RepID=A0A5C7AWJ6_9FLAO|nr:hypothetical protein [Seonamhaeicola algicola]TXE10052.1 hypothetical protein FUA26_11280 [Seonamhaeicola algicola]
MPKIILIGFVLMVSCSKDTVDENTSIYGTWQNISLINQSTHTLNLIFGKGGLSAKINTIEDAQGHIISNFQGNKSWKNNNGIIEIELASGETETYKLNAQGQLEANNQNSFVLNKISNDYTLLEGDK